MIGWIGAALLAVCPGAWLAFTPRTHAHRPLTRFALAVTFSPIVVAAEFIALRLLGVGADAVPLSLVAMNVPAAVLIWLRFRRPASQDANIAPLHDRGGELAAFAIVGVITLASFGPRLTDEDDRAFSGHAWMHADTCYQIANGSIDPEESLLAGVRQTVPWVGHVWPAIASKLIDRPPVVTYFWFNLLWLLVVAVLIAATARNLSSRPMVGPVAVVLLFFGVNVVGYWAGKAATAVMAAPLPGFGDPRFTPWLLKYAFFNQMPFALAAVAAVAYLATREPARGDTLLAAVALATVAFIYPLLAPVAGLLLVGRAFTLLRSAERRRTGVILAASVVAIAIGAYVHLRFLTAERVSSPLDLSTMKAFLRKCGDVAFALLPLVAGWWLGRKEERGGRPLVLVGAVALALYVALHLPGWRNEYKFVFGAALCLAPVAAAGIAPLFARGARLRFLAFTVFAALLASPMAMKTFGHPEWGPRPRPRIDTAAFALRLHKSESLAGATDAIRRWPPVDTIVVAPDTTFHLPTVMGRGLYVTTGRPVWGRPAADVATPPFGQGHAGFNLEGTYLIYGVRGHDPTIDVERREWRTAFQIARAAGAQLIGLTPTWFKPEAQPPPRNRKIALLFRLPDDDLDNHGLEVFNDGTWAVRVLSVWLGGYPED